MQDKKITACLKIKKTILKNIKFYLVILVVKVICGNIAHLPTNRETAECHKIKLAWQKFKTKQNKKKTQRNLIFMFLTIPKFNSTNLFALILI